jgi:cyclophilin family peptidyl-prolyl cis-trans isomerase
MKQLLIISLGCIFLLQAHGCVQKEEKEKVAKKPEKEVVSEKREVVEKEEVQPAEPEAVKAALSAKERVELALSLKEKEVSLTGTEKARIETNKGTFVIEFYPEDAPNTVKNFIKLAKSGFYDGLTFHRYVADFVIQGGDPRGDGTGDAGYNIDAEFNKRKHVTGTVAMARSRDPNSASCQWYVTLSPKPHLDGSYTVFGQVIEGMEAVNLLRAGDVMEKITIE